MATSVVGKSRFTRTSESDISYQILYNRSEELQEAIVDGSTDKLVDTVLQDYGWSRESGFGRVRRVENVVNQLKGVYGKRSLRTSENDICRHILAHHSKDIRSADLVQTVMEDYGWQNNCALSRYFQRNRIKGAVQLALANLKVQYSPEVYVSINRGEGVRQEDYPQYTDEEWEALTQAPRCFFIIAEGHVHLGKGSFSDRKKDWKKTVESVRGSFAFCRQGIAKAHHKLTERCNISPARVYRHTEAYLPERRVEQESVRDSDEFPDLEELLEESKMADQVRRDVERDMSPPSLDFSKDTPFQVFKDFRLEDIYRAYHRFDKFRLNEQRNQKALLSFVGECRKGKCEPEALFIKYRSYLIDLFEPVQDPNKFCEILLDLGFHPKEGANLVEELKLFREIAFDLYNQIHGKNQTSEVKIQAFFESQIQYTCKRTKIMEKSSLLDEYIRNCLPELGEKLQDPDLLRDVITQLRSNMEGPDDVTISYTFEEEETDDVEGLKEEKEAVPTPTTFLVPESVERDFIRGTPALTIRDPNTVSFDPLASNSRPLLERPDAMEFIRDLSNYCERFANEREMTSSQRQDLFRNLLLLSGQTVQNLSGTNFAMGIDLTKLFMDWNSTIAPREGVSIQLDWNEGKGHFDVKLTQSFEVRIHEASIEGEELRQTGILTLSTHFQLAPEEDSWEWHGPQFKPEEVVFRSLYSLNTK